MKINGQEVKTVFVIDCDDDGKPELHEYLFVEKKQEHASDGVFITYLNGARAEHRYLLDGKIFECKEDAITTIHKDAQKNIEDAKKKLEGAQRYISFYEKILVDEVKVVPLTFS